MKKVAIVTLYGEYNLGNKLQNYAVEYLIDEMGAAPTTLVTTMRRSFLLRVKYLLLDLLSVFPIWTDRRLIEHRMMHKRSRTIAGFSKKYLHYSKKIDYASDVELKRINNEYDLFVTGSDQVWGSFVDEDADAFNYFFLEFADKNKRGSISPSLGRENIPNETRDNYTKALKEIKWLSCREQGMLNLIEELTGRTAQLLLDPTMVVPVKIWKSIEKEPVYFIPSQYILDYRLGTDKDRTDTIVRKISEKTGLQVINIYNTKSVNEIFEKTGPAEFLWLIDNASLIVTDSFHGCVFSILFNKEFICIDRTETSNTVNMSDRLATLLGTFGMTNRIYSEELLKNIFSSDYSSTNEIILSEREKMINYIREMME